MKDYTGKRYGFIEIIGEAERTDPKKIYRRVQCVCNCGKEFTARLASVKSGNTSSCGCLKKAKARISMVRINKKRGK